MLCSGRSRIRGALLRAAPRPETLSGFCKQSARFWISTYREYRMAETAKNNALVSDELASKFKTEKETPYTRWVKTEGLDIIPSFYVSNLRTVALKPWTRRGGSAVFLNHDASRTSNDCYVMEIPPGKSLAPHRQLYEEMVLVLAGPGSTAVRRARGARTNVSGKEDAPAGTPATFDFQGGHV